MSSFRGPFLNMCVSGFLCSAPGVLSAAADVAPRDGVLLTVRTGYVVNCVVSRALTHGSDTK